MIHCSFRIPVALCMIVLLLPLLVTSDDPSTPIDRSDFVEPGPYTRSFQLSLQQKQANLIKKFDEHTHLHLTIKNGNITSMIDSARKVKLVNPYTHRARKSDFDPSGWTLDYLNERFVVNFKPHQTLKNNPYTLRMILSLLSNELVDPRNYLFTSIESRDKYGGVANSTAFLQIDRFPHRRSHASFIAPMMYPECKEGSRCYLYFHKIGRTIAVAILNKQFMDITFTSSFYKSILSKKIELGDIKEINPALFNNLSAVLNSNYSPNSTITMTYQHFDGVKTEPRDLMTDGSRIRVTEENKKTYVDLMVQAYINNHVTPAMNALRSGLYETVPRPDIMDFSEEELRILISGNTHVDVSEWKKYTKSNAMLRVFNSRAIDWFWEMVDEWDLDMRSRLLLYTTGTSRLPIGGFKVKWSSMPCSAWFNLIFHPEARVPQASPADGWVFLPRFSSPGLMKQKFKEAVRDDGGVSTWYDSNDRYSAFHGTGNRLAYRH